MRHRMRGRKLGRSPSHRRAMLRNMACSLLRTLDQDEDDPHRAKVPGRIVTTLPKAKELRPFVEKLVTLAKKGRQFELVVPEAPQKLEDQVRNERREQTAEWKRWKGTPEYTAWNQATAPAIACRRRAFALLRDKDAVSILFDELADRFADRAGGYTRIIKLANVRLGDAGRQALIEFVGEDDTIAERQPSLEVDDDDADQDTDADEPTEAGEDVAAEAGPDGSDPVEAGEEEDVEAVGDGETSGEDEPQDEPQDEGDADDEVESED
ncbi:MAG: L17 family ribosomal protein [Planctomycetaceae bacterium]|nr:L17 family ribosomal protein [Planctomycetaceae bacterium]